MGCEHSTGDKSIVVVTVTIVEPLNKLAVLPQRFLLRFIMLFPHEADAILLAILPLAPIGLGAEGPHVLAISIPQVVAKLASIEAGAVLPLKTTFPVHFALKPLATIYLPVRPAVNADATYLIFDELSFVHAPVRHFKHPLAFFHSVFVFSLVFRSVWPFFDAVSVLLVIMPVSLVASSTRLNAHSLTVHFVKSPCSLKYRFILVDENAFSTRLSIGPLPKIIGPVREEAKPFAVAQPI